MTTEKSKTTEKSDAQSSKRSGDILIDYRGRANPETSTNDDGDTVFEEEVEHIRSPLIIPITVNGALDIVLQPGANVFARDLTPVQVAKGQKLSDAERWEQFIASGSAESTQALDMIDRGMITILGPRDIAGAKARELINRTIDPTALTWLEHNCKDRKDGEALINLIEIQRASKTRCRYTPTAFQLPVQMKKYAEQTARV